MSCWGWRAALPCLAAGKLNIHIWPQIRVQWNLNPAVLSRAGLARLRNTGRAVQTLGRAAWLGYGLAWQG